MMSRTSSSSHEMPSGDVQYITTVTDNDIILGRGLASVKHPGNIFFHKVIQQKRNEYASSCRRRIKKDVSNEIWTIFCDHSCRFVLEVKQEVAPSQSDTSESPSKLWIVAEKRKVLQKIKQALRENDSKPGTVLPKSTKIKNKSIAVPHTTRNQNNMAATKSDSVCVIPGSSSNPISISDHTCSNRKVSDGDPNARSDRQSLLHTSERCQLEPAVPYTNKESTRNHNNMAESKSVSVCAIPGLPSNPIAILDHSRSTRELSDLDPNSRSVLQSLFHTIERRQTVLDSARLTVGSSYGGLLSNPPTVRNSSLPDFIIHQPNVAPVQVGTVSIVLNYPIWTVTAPASTHLIAGIQNRVCDTDLNPILQQLVQNQCMNSQSRPAQTGLNPGLVPQPPPYLDVQRLLTINERNLDNNFTPFHNVIGSGTSTSRTHPDPSILTTSNMSEHLAKLFIQQLMR